MPQNTDALTSAACGIAGSNHSSTADPHTPAAFAGAFFRVIITTGSFFADGTPETHRIISRHRTLQAAERALAAYRRISLLEGLRAMIVSE